MELKTLKTNELVKEIAETTGLTQSDVTKVFNEFEKIVLDYTRKGYKVPLPGLGYFRPEVKPPRTARNPRTGEKVELPQRTVLKFKVKSTVKILD